MAGEIIDPQDLVGEVFMDEPETAPQPAPYRKVRTPEQSAQSWGHFRSDFLPGVGAGLAAWPEQVDQLISSHNIVPDEWSEIPENPSFGYQVGRGVGEEIPTLPLRGATLTKDILVGGASGAAMPADSWGERGINAAAGAVGGLIGTGAPRVKDWGVRQFDRLFPQMDKPNSIREMSDRFAGNPSRPGQRRREIDEQLQGSTGLVGEPGPNAALTSSNRMQTGQVDPAYAASRASPDANTPFDIGEDLAVRFNLQMEEYTQVPQSTKDSVIRILDSYGLMGNGAGVTWRNIYDAEAMLGRLASKQELNAAKMIGEVRESLTNAARAGGAANVDEPLYRHVAQGADGSTVFSDDPIPGGTRTPNGTGFQTGPDPALPAPGVEVGPSVEIPDTPNPIPNNPWRTRQEGQIAAATELAAEKLDFYNNPIAKNLRDRVNRGGTLDTILSVGAKDSGQARNFINFVRRHSPEDYALMREAMRDRVAEIINWSGTQTTEDSIKNAKKMLDLVNNENSRHVMELLLSPEDMRYLVIGANQRINALDVVEPTARGLHLSLYGRGGGSDNPARVVVSPRGTETVGNIQGDPVHLEPYKSMLERRLEERLSDMVKLGVGYERQKDDVQIPQQ